MDKKCKNVKFEKCCTSDICPELAERIFRLKQRCLSIREISKTVHKSEKYVSLVIDKNGWREIGVAQVRALRKEGYTIKEIARRIHVRESVVSYVLGRRKTR